MCSESSVTCVPPRNASGVATSRNARMPKPDRTHGTRILTQTARAGCSRSNPDPRARARCRDSGGSVSSAESAGRPTPIVLGLDAAEVALVRAAVVVESVLTSSRPAARRAAARAGSRGAAPASGSPRTTTRARASSRRAREREHALLGVVGLEPPEASRVEVALPQRRLVAVGAVEVAHERLHAGVLGFSSRCQSSERSWLHSCSWANSLPMNSSFLPGCAHMYAYSARRLASCCQRSPGILESIEPLPCTTSSCDSGRMKFSVNA